MGPDGDDINNNVRSTAPSPCERRVPERAYYETSNHYEGALGFMHDRILPFLDRPEEKREYISPNTRMVGSRVSSRKYMSFQEGYYNDGSPRITEIYGGYESPTKSN